MSKRGPVGMATGASVSERRALVLSLREPVGVVTGASVSERRALVLSSSTVDGSVGTAGRSTFLGTAGIGISCAKTKAPPRRTRIEDFIILKRGQGSDRLLNERRGSELGVKNQ